MMRFDGMAGFAPKSLGTVSMAPMGAATRRPAAQAVAPAPVRPAPRMAQVIEVSPEFIEAKLRLDEAQMQLGALLKNFDSVVAAFGAADAATALVEAKRSVEMYQQSFGTQLQAEQL